MATDITIASNALVLIGDNPISSFVDPGGGATAAGNLYSDAYTAFLAMHPWTFALKEQELSRLTQVPDSKVNLTYAFQMPSDHIRTWIVYPQNTHYEIVGSLLYSNEPELLMRYIYRVDETQLPPHAVRALTYLLAMDFAQLITESTSKSEYFYERYLTALGSAMAIDSQGHPQQPIIHSPFLEVR